MYNFFYFFTSSLAPRFFRCLEILTSQLGWVSAQRANRKTLTAADFPASLLSRQASSHWFKIPLTHLFGHPHDLPAHIPFGPNPTCICIRFSSRLNPGGIWDLLGMVRVRLIFSSLELQSWQPFPSGLSNFKASEVQWKLSIIVLYFSFFLFASVASLEFSTRNPHCQLFVSNPEVIVPKQMTKSTESRMMHCNAASSRHTAPHHPPHDVPSSHLGS